jgi:hypothetical protein
MLENSLKIPFNGAEFFINIAEGNMVNLNHLHQISGASPGKEPKEWNKLDSTKNLIKSINGGKSPVLKTRRGANGGTWAHWQLALSYAQYLSTELHIVVNQAFKDRLEEVIDPELGIERSAERARKSWKAQGKSDKWIAEREQGKHIHGAYVNTLVKHDVKPGKEIGQCTNQIYKGLFQKNKIDIEKSLREKNPSLPKKINIRDYAKLSSLAAISLSEALSSERIEHINAIGVGECSKVSLEKAISVRLALNDSRAKDNLCDMRKNTEHDREKINNNIQPLKNALKTRSTSEIQD